MTIARESSKHDGLIGTYRRAHLNSQVAWRSCRMRALDGISITAIACADLRAATYLIVVLRCPAASLDLMFKTAMDVSRIVDERRVDAGS
jgi:hypothetical protein